MKTIPAILLAAALLIGFPTVKVCAQAVAIGHVSAEVVESASASSKAITGFDIRNNSSLSVNNQDRAVNYENLDLGEIKINSGHGIACNIVMKSAELSDLQGNGFTIEPTALNSNQANPQRLEGNQTLRLKGKAHMTHGQASGLYQGNYTMVFAFN